MRPTHDEDHSEQDDESGAGDVERTSSLRLISRLCCTSPLDGRIPPGDDVHVDSGRCGQSRDLPDDGPPAQYLSPSTAFARADHDLGDMAGAGEVDERLCRVVSPNPGPF